MSIILYDYTRAPSPQRARILLAEKQIAHETVQIDLVGGKQLSAEFKAINPRCTVPALKLEDGTVLTDNAGIAAWAEAFQPDPPLMGTTPTEKGIVASWNARVEQECFLPVADVVRNRTKGMADRALTGPHNFAQIPQLAERGAMRLEHFYEELERHLAGNEYIAGAAFSLADITGMVAIGFAHWIKILPGAKHPEINRWYATVSARETAKA